VFAGIYLKGITDYCAMHDLPCLARLVVKKETGEPSKELPGTNEEVFDLDWINYPTPSPEDFE
jgi:hypothetical protein